VDEFRETAGGGFFQGLEEGLRRQEKTGGVECGGRNLGLEDLDVGRVETPNVVS
jgi:hypothetical protein